jgi:hypothetical protein
MGGMPFLPKVAVTQSRARIHAALQNISNLPDSADSTATNCSLGGVGGGGAAALGGGLTFGAPAQPPGITPNAAAAVGAAAPFAPSPVQPPEPRFALQQLPPAQQQLLEQRVAAYQQQQQQLLLAAALLPMATSPPHAAVPQLLPKTPAGERRACAMWLDVVSLCNQSLPCIRPTPKSVKQVGRVGSSGKITTTESHTNM